MSESPKPKKELELKKWLEDGVKHLLDIVEDPKKFFFSVIRQILSPKIIFLLLVIAGIAWLSFYAGGCKPEKEVAQIKSDFTDSNTFWTIQKRTDDGTIQDLRKSFYDYRQTNESIIVNLKTDLNETKREKDADISKLMIERDNALQRATMWETMPANVSTIYSNFVVNTPTNMFGIVSMLTDLSNAVSQTSLSPSFNFYINHTRVTNNTVIVFSPSRSVLFQAKNLGNFSAEHLTFLFMSFLDDTNLIRSHDWENIGRGFLGNDILTPAGANSWRTVATEPTASETIFSATTFTISTNITIPAFLNARVDLYSDKSKLQTYTIFLVVNDFHIPKNAVLPPTLFQIILPPE